MLVTYFGRIVFVFLVMWGPYFLLNYVLATWLPTWIIFAGGTFSHFQGPASAAVCLLKPDVYFAVKRFIKCQSCCCGGNNKMNERSDSFYNQHNAVDDSYTRGSVWQKSTTFFISMFSNTSNRNALTTVEPQNSSTTQDESTRHNEKYLWPDDDGEYTIENKDAPYHDVEEDGQQQAETTTMNDNNAISVKSDYNDTSLTTKAAVAC